MITADLAEKIWNEIEHADSIILHFHPGPDGDSIGSALGLAQALRGLGKQVTVLRGDSPLPGYLLHLPGMDTVVPQTFLEIDQSEFNLFLILDSASKEQISRTGEVVFAPELKTIVIDHHSTNSGYAQINLIDSTAPATAQLVYELLAWKKIPISVETATCLLVGLFTDTGGYQYPPTGPATFQAAAALSAIAPQYHAALFPIQNTSDARNLAYQGIALRNIELHPLSEGKQLALTAVSLEELEELDLNPEFADKSSIANMLKAVVGWEVGVAMVEIEMGTVKVSFRTRDAKTYNVGQISAKLGGGGHPAAAGLTLKMSLNEAKQAIIKAVQDWKV